MTLLIVGGEDLGAAAQVFKDQGWSVFSGLPLGAVDPKANLAVVRFGPLAAFLKEADSRQLRYKLVHVGLDDGEPEGSHARANWVVSLPELTELAARLKTRDRMLVNVVAFGFKHGIPQQATWVFDMRFLDNPYWVPELKPMTGMEAPVRRYVLDQPAAHAFLEAAGRLLEEVLPRLRAQGSSDVTVALGCTGGRHRSVVAAAELARRLEANRELEVKLTCRELADGDVRR